MTSRDTTAPCQVGVIGLAVMGANLALNLERRGFRVALYNRTTSRTRDLVSSHPEATDFLAVETPAALVEILERPRRILLMVKAGEAVDRILEDLVPLLDAGDVVVDGGNSHYRQTEARQARLAEHGIQLMGLGVSGGERGALEGPSLMPGGSLSAWKAMEPILTAIAARTPAGEPCCAHLGPGGAGHFIKMIHNGIEYADMQLIAEAHQILAHGAGLKADQIAETMEAWAAGVNGSFLLEITARILRRRDEKTGGPLLEAILDQAEHKGTGRWTVEAALDYGISVPTIATALDARIWSANRDQRMRMAHHLPPPSPRFPDSSSVSIVHDLEQALFAAKICTYAQGFSLLSRAALRCDWNTRLEDVARVWRAGCIIRNRFLATIIEACELNPDLDDLRLARTVSEQLVPREKALRRVVTESLSRGLSIPALTTSLSWHDGTRQLRGTGAMIQAQRDYFGAHTYRRLDEPGVFHTEWETEEPS